MLRRTLSALLLAVLVMSFAACGRNKTKNPLADLDSKQPDKVLFDRAMAALKKSKFDVARLTLQTLINTYPESEYVARAKLAVGDAWYAEGGSAALAQAEIEYKDFITFFPNMPEAAEAQLKVADIHYRQMTKPDRDFTHAKRAEEEYKQLLLQFPDTDKKILEDARTRLMQVQEVLAEREFRIGWFYFKTRESYAAAIARLQSLVDTYPLYSGASEALYILGNAYERQVENIRATGFTELAKARLIQQYTDKAAEAYSRILTRYPVTERVNDAKERLGEMKRPIPEPTAEALALNKSEEESRGRTGMVSRIFSNLRSSPDMARASKVGEPTMVEPNPTSAPEIIRSATRTIEEASATGAGTVSAEVVRSGAPPSNDPVPSSQPRINDATQPAEGAAETPAPPPQINYANQEEAAGEKAPAQADSGKGAKDKDKKDDDSFSTSKKKKKKGLRKIVPF